MTAIRQAVALTLAIGVVVHATACRARTGTPSGAAPGLATLVPASHAEGTFDELSVQARVSEPPFRQLSQLEIWPHVDQTIASKALRQRLLQNRFVVDGDVAFQEFFALYESNRYRPLVIEDTEEEITYLKGLPSVVTPDVVVHNLHLFSTLVLSRIEEEHFAPRLAAMLESLSAETSRQAKAARMPELQRAARDNLVFLAVGYALLRGVAPPSEANPHGFVEPDPDPLGTESLAAQLAGFDETLDLDLPADVRQAARIEFERVLRAQGQEPPTIFAYPAPFKEDYTQYVPRAHYLKTRELTAYFRATTWLSRMACFATSESGLRSAALLTLAATTQRDVLSSWQQITDALSFLVGPPDDLTFYEMLPALARIYGPRPSLEGLGDPQRFAAFAAEVATLAPPSIQGIVTGTRHGPGVGETKAFHFFSQHRVLDAVLFQALVDPLVPDRTMVTALEVPDVLGSALAAKILHPKKLSAYEGYARQREALGRSLPAALDREKTRTTYAGWLHTLGALLPRVPDGYPAFMTNDAYAAWRLNSWLGGYAELKHDTALYGKQAMAEFGGGGQTESDVEIDVRGYVVPEISLYSRAGSLLRILRSGLEARGLFPASITTSYGRFQELVRMLTEISRKELVDEPLGPTELDLIRNIGGDLEHFWIETLVDRRLKEQAKAHIETENAQLIADVFSGYVTPEERGVLHVATGYVHPVWVVFARDGKLRLGRGGVLSFYELVLPGRTGDAAWRAMLKERRPPRPGWQSAFLAEQGTEPWWVGPLPE